MGLKIIEKYRLINYIKNSVSAYKYQDLLSLLDKKRNNHNNKDLIEFLLEYSLKEISKEHYSHSLLKRLLIVLYEVIINADNLETIITKDMTEQFRTLLAFYNKENLYEEIDINIIKEIKYLINIKEINDSEDYLLRINNYKERIKELNRLIQNLESDNELSKKNIEYLKRQIQYLQEELDTSRKSNKSHKKIIDDLEIELADIRTALSKTNTSLTNLEIDNAIKNGRLKSLSRNNDSMSRSLLNYEINSYNELMLKERIDESVKIIISLILEDKASEEIIEEELSNNNIFLNNEEYKIVMSKVREKINITTSSFNGQKNYKLLMPYYYKNQFLDLEADSDCIDILLVSDLHLTTSSYVDKNIEKIYEYATNNGISLILNLGDFFGFKTDAKDAITKYNNGCYLVEKCINLIPRVTGIYHAILGGNHDKDSLKYGYDALKIFTDNREDFINLGYDSASITINGKLSNKTSFLIHHLQKKVTDPLSKNGFNPNDYHEYLTNYHNAQGMLLKNYYTSMLGGSHMNGIYSNFILVPSLLNDRKYNGAMHLRIFLNEKKEIDNIIVINLINDYKLIAASEILYKK